MRQRLHPAIPPALIAFAGAFALYAATAARTITTRFGGTDGGELAAVALSGGVAHPSGYPTYLLLARAALLIPWAEPAARLALLSSLCSALAVGCTVLIVAGFCSAVPAPAQQSRWIAGLYAGLALALCERVWSQAVIVEVYALHLLGLTICALLLHGWIGSGRGWLLVLAAYALGLGLGVHLTLAALIPAGLVAWIVAPNRPRVTLRQGLVAIAALLAGLALYGFLPLWAARQAVPSWGDPASLSALWQHVSAVEYRYLVGAVTWTQRLGRLGHAARDLVSQPGPIGLALALGWGLPWGWHNARSLLALSGGVALCSLLFAIGYGGADSDVYLLPWTWAWCVWAGLGLASLWTHIGGAWQKTMRRGLAAILALALGWTLAAQYQRLDLHADSSDRDRVAGLLNALDFNALLFTSADADTFGAWYLQKALATRGDVVVIDTRLLRWRWYRRQLAGVIAAGDDRLLCQSLQTTDRPRYWIDETGAVQKAVSAPLNPAICATE